VLANTPADFRVGLLCGLAAHALWGLMPLYFRAVAGVPPLELLAHRIVWSLLFLVLLLTIQGRWAVLFCTLGNPSTRYLLTLSSFLIAVNWFVFIYGVSIGQIVQNSLGYFINPLLNIFIGLLVFGERLRPAQWLAVGLAACGLTYLVIAQWQIPWIALSLASSFSAYALIRKTTPVDALVGLTVETLFLTPVAGGMLTFWYFAGQSAVGQFGWQVDGLLLLSGVVTAVPLLFFGAAARRLPMTVIGFLQYLAPSLQFLLAVLWLGEAFHPVQRVAFPIIWAALALVTVDSLLRNRRQVLTSDVEKKTVVIDEDGGECVLPSSPVIEGQGQSN
jgi:chloramphenicol-sensitive protein RarD